jgi:hypothetical protein
VPKRCLEEPTAPDAAIVVLAHRMVVRDAGLLALRRAEALEEAEREIARIADGPARPRRQERETAKKRCAGHAGQSLEGLSPVHDVRIAFS